MLRWHISHRNLLPRSFVQKGKNVEPIVCSKIEASGGSLVEEIGTSTASGTDSIIQRIHRVNFQPKPSCTGDLKVCLLMLFKTSM